MILDRTAGMHLQMCYKTYVSKTQNRTHTLLAQYSHAWSNLYLLMVPLHLSVLRQVPLYLRSALNSTKFFNLIVLNETYSFSSAYVFR